MPDINLTIVIPKDAENSQLVRAILRIIGFAKNLLRKVERGEEV